MPTFSSLWLILRDQHGRCEIVPPPVSTIEAWSQWSCNEHRGRLLSIEELWESGIWLLCRWIFHAAWMLDGFVVSSRSTKYSKTNIVHPSLQSWHHLTFREPVWITFCIIQHMRTGIPISGVDYLLLLLVVLPLWRVAAGQSVQVTTELITHAAKVPIPCGFCIKVKRSGGALLVIIEEESGWERERKRET